MATSVAVWCRRFLRPWYSLGPRHRWPLLLLPFYGLAMLLPACRASTHRLGQVTLDQLGHALISAIEPPPADVRIVDVPAIRAATTTLPDARSC